MGTDAILLRTQSDRRLVRLVHEGYESAFEEIVRRYRRPLDRFAASIVGGRSEDVTQDSFRKALEALRRDDGEIELRPWLYRIVRNTALNDLRDRPPAAAELAEELMAGGRSAAAEAEERAEIAALTAMLRALPENQRAALVMRELEGMSHEEIAATLGISGGGARQAIARGRAAVRGGFGALVPLPLLRALASGGGATEAVAGGGGAATAGAAGEAIGAGGAGAAAGGVGASLLGGGGAAALKVGLATVVVAGGIGAGVAVEHHGGGHHRQEGPQPVAEPAPAPAPAPGPVPARQPASDPVPGGRSGDGVGSSPSSVVAEDHPRHESRHRGRGDEAHEVGHTERSHGDDHEAESGAVAEPVVDDEPAPSVHSGGGPGPSATSGDHGGGGPGPSNPNSGHEGGDHSGKGSGSSDATEVVVESPPVEASSSESSSGGPGPSSSSSGGGGGDSGSSDGPEISP